MIHRMRALLERNRYHVVKVHRFVLGRPRPRLFDGGGRAAPGPVVRLPRGSKPLRGRPSLVVEHGTYRCPSSLTEVVEVEDRPEWRSLAFWRRLLPGVAVQVTYHPLGTFTAAGLRNHRCIGALRPTDDPPDDRSGMASSVRVEVLPGVFADVPLHPTGAHYALTPDQQARLMARLRGAA